MAYEVPAAAVRLRRARADDRRADDAPASRQAPPGLREHRQRRARGHRVGRQARRGGPQEPRLAARATSRPPCATTPAATTTTRCSGSGCRPTAAASPTATCARRSTSAFGSFDDFKAQFKDNGVKRFGSGWTWLVHDGSGSRSSRTRQPGQPDLRRQDAAARHRRLGARLLPHLPEPPPRLPRRVVERRQLGEGGRGVRSSRAE